MTCTLTRYEQHSRKKSNKKTPDYDVIHGLWYKKYDVNPSKTISTIVRSSKYTEIIDLEENLSDPEKLLKWNNTQKLLTDNVSTFNIEV